MPKMNDLLLDTHIFLWLLNGSPKMSEENRESSANSGGRICISAIFVWETAMLEQKSLIIPTQPVGKWLEQALKLSSAKTMELSAEILLDSCNLSGDFQSDPADRMIAATSRINNIPLITQDEQILSYIKRGVLSKIIQALQFCGMKTCVLRISRFSYHLR
jgi:PIN domain nuclease of toxin-antitoxin system